MGRIGSRRSSRHHVEAVLLVFLLGWMISMKGFSWSRPFRRDDSILLCLPSVSIAQPFAVRLRLSPWRGDRTGAPACSSARSWRCDRCIAHRADLLPSLRAFHPPGNRLSPMFPVLLHPGPWFAVRVVLPFTLSAVISYAVDEPVAETAAAIPAPRSTEARPDESYLSHARMILF